MRRMRRVRRTSLLFLLFSFLLELLELVILSLDRFIYTLSTFTSPSIFSRQSSFPLFPPFFPSILIAL
jgi:hypothetical protein